MSTLAIPPRFCGPPVSGNGGWTAGALASHLGHHPVRVRLCMPPPLEVELDVALSDEGDTAALLLGTDVVAEAARAEPVTTVAAVDRATARAAEASYPGRGPSHPFPTCFVCGPDRAAGDGLRIFPGRAGAGVAATWTPGDDVDVPITWAALDCSGGWASDLEARPAVLGTITVEVHRLPVPGEEHVVVGEERGSEGRRVHTASSLYDSAGGLVASAEHVWIVVDPARFR